MAKNSRVITSEQAKSIDTSARESFGISTLILMENAGIAVAEEAMKLMKPKTPIAVICGRGNNGGDGFVAARQLLAKGISPEIYLAGKISDVQNEARVNLDIILKLKQKVFEVSEENLELVKKKISRCSLIIDALLGVGLQGRVRGIFCDLIEAINISQAFVLSVDIPSGLDGTTGVILGSCVRADKTVTFVARKSGMIAKHAKKLCGKIVVRDLGIVL
ncbi:MAG: NAD(P)H-hydrate epimerase [Candidatus Omnitrophica bacterium]|nr:NAD(P)H-hydrate epimerase [Candidatus Omnitrophota bacterium]